jgi:CheY-like chemotaxis protein
MKTALLAEDSKDDIFFMEMACERADIPHLLQIVTDGEMAVNYLCGNHTYSNRAIHPMPDVVFLDVNMPNRTGHEVLAWIRSQPTLKRLPVVMLTGSVLIEDVKRAYGLGANSYLQKSGNQTEFRRTIGIILKYWLELNIASA